jgi:polar amino acid transport system substrate-binding protein
VRIAGSTRRKLATLLVVLGMVSTAGCAVGQGGTSEGTESEFETVEPGKLTFAMSGEYRPFNFYDEDNKLVGFDVDMGNEIAERLGLEPNPVTGPFNTLLAGLVGGRYDTIIGSMAATEEREQQADFTQPYYSAGAQLFVAKDSTVKSADDLKSATVGVALGTTFEDFANDLDGVEKVTTYQSDIHALREVENGRLTAAITSAPLGLYQIQEAGLDVMPAGDELYPDEAAIPVAKGNKELLDAIDKALDDIKKDGTYAEISEKWFGRDIS